MMRSGEHKQHVHNSYEKETASSLNVTDTDEDTDEDKSNHSIAQSFDEPSSENQDSESDYNYVNTTTEMNHNEYIKPSASVKENYYKIFNVDVYIAGGVDGSCVFQSTGGSSGGAYGAGFSDAVNAF